MDVPKLEGWATFPEAAAELGVTKQAIHKMVFENGEFQSLRAVGSKPVYVISIEEVQAKKESRHTAALERQQKREEREARLEQRRQAKESVSTLTD